MAPTTFNSSNGRSTASEREGGRQGEGGERQREREKKRGRNVHSLVAREFWSREELGERVSQGLLDCVVSMLPLLLPRCSVPAGCSCGSNAATCQSPAGRRWGTWRRDRFNRTGGVSFKPGYL